MRYDFRNLEPMYLGTGYGYFHWIVDAESRASAWTAVRRIDGLATVALTLTRRTP